MREEVLKLLADKEMLPAEKYNKAFEIYRNSKGKDMGKVVAYNRGFNMYELKNLLYDLQKLYKITDVEKATYVPKVVIEEVESKDETIDSTTGNNGGSADQTEQDKLELEEVKTTLRETFPFLSEPDCPDELKILVADKITLWHKLKDTRIVLDKIAQGEEVENAEEYSMLAVELFEEEQAINDELLHYQEKREILGKHIKLQTLAIEAEIKGKNPTELHKVINSGKAYISKQQKEIREKNPDEKKLVILNDRIAKAELRIKLAKKALGINE
jgi:hypothetical protein